MKTIKNTEKTRCLTISISNCKVIIKGGISEAKKAYLKGEISEAKKA